MKNFKSELYKLNMHYCKEMARKCWSDFTRMETHKHIKSIQRWERIYLEEGEKRLMKERRGCSPGRCSGRTTRSGTRFIRRAISAANATWRTVTRSRTRHRRRSNHRRADLHSTRRMRSRSLISDASKTKRCGRRRKRGCGKSLECSKKKDWLQVEHRLAMHWKSKYAIRN